MLHACGRFELHTFSSFREIETNSLLPRIADQQLRHFRHQWGSSKSRKTTISDSLKNLLADFNDTYIVVQQI